MNSRIENGYLVISVSEKRNANEIEIVLLSRSIPFSTEWSPPGRVFYIPESFSDIARNEIQSYQDENANWPPPANAAKETLYPFSPINYLVVLALAGFHWFTTEYAYSAAWVKQGMLSTAYVKDGQLYRVVTALCLHADISHLLSNVFGLLIFLAGIGHLIGGGISWLLVLVAAALGNYASMLVSGIGYQAIGASTAVFSAVGILGALGMRRYLNDKGSRNRFFIPLVASLGLFAMLGTNPRTDVIAHLFGLLAGIGVGILFSPLLGHKLLNSNRVQWVSFCLFLIIIGQSWRTQLAY